MRHVFEEVTVTATKRATCPLCGKKGTRTRTFRQTINPANRNADGTVRTRAQVRAALLVEAEPWKRDPDGTHDRCRLAAQAVQ